MLCSDHGSTTRGRSRRHSRGDELRREGVHPGRSGVGRHRRRPSRTGRPACDRLRDRSHTCDRDGVRRAGTAVGGHRGLQRLGPRRVVRGAAAPARRPSRCVRGLHTPLGLLWIGDSLYVASKERVDAYTGFDGTAFASERAVVSFPPGVGEVNGLALGPDGRIRLGISAPCDHCTPSSDLSGAVVSFVPDGTDVRSDATGIRAPIGLAYFPGTSELFVSMNQRDDLDDQTPGDWLSIVQPGQSWGFPDCYGQGGSVCAGTPGPVAELDEHAAVSGVAIVTRQLGDSTGTAGARSRPGSRARCSASGCARTVPSKAARPPLISAACRTRSASPSAPTTPSTPATGRPGPFIGSVSDCAGNHSVIPGSSRMLDPRHDEGR